MREIRFRGILTEAVETSIDGAEVGDWVYGNLAFRDTIYSDFIEESGGVSGCTGLCTISCAIDPTTVGQFTGLHDKNGKEIYEGDIINMIDHWYDGDGHMIGFIGKVIFEDGCYVVDDNHEFRSMCLDKAAISNYGFEIIGNIHEKPTLL